MSTHTTRQISVDLPTPQPFDAPGVFGFFAHRAISGVETVYLDEAAGRLRYARTVRLPHGPGAIEVTAEMVEGSWRLRLRAEVTSRGEETATEEATTDGAAAVAMAYRLFDLDTDPAAIDRVLMLDPHLTAAVARTPGIRVPDAVDAEELVVRAIIGQQISVAAALTHLNRLTVLAGSPTDSGFSGLTTFFPSAEQLLQAIPDPGVDADLAPDRPLRLPRRSIHTMRAVTEALSTGELQLDATASPRDLQTELVALPGIGAWTAAYVSMRVLNDPDAWLIGDVALVAGAKELGVLPCGLSRSAAHRALASHADAWAPWRSYAAMHLWQAISKNRAE